MSDRNKILKSYFSDYRLGVILFVMESLVLFAVLILSDIPRDVTSYLLFLHIFLFFVIFILSFALYYRRYKKLKFILEHNTRINFMKDMKGFGDKEIYDLYHLIIEDCHGLLNEEELKHESKLKLYQEYYTMWVHQIKTPIFALELLLRGENPEHNRTSMQIELLKIKDYSQLALQYIRMENMGTDLELKEYRLIDIVKNQLKKYALFFINENIKLNLEEFEWNVLTDEKWLSFVLGQVLTNALKYIGREGTIHIYLEDEMLVVADNGIGIRQEDVPRLFDKGFTGNNGRLKKDASGMGLYLSAKVMKNLGHDISLSSVQGEGTKVFLIFSKRKIEEY